MLPAWFLDVLQAIRIGIASLDADCSLDPGIEPILPAAEDVAEIAYHDDDTDGDQRSAFLVVRLANGSWLYASYYPAAGLTDDPYWVFRFAATRQRLWWWAMTDDDRERCTPRMTRDELDEELVQIDELLESTDPEVRAKGEQRMLQRHAPGSR